MILPDSEGGNRIVILYDLRCSQGHRFEGWFRDWEAYEEQKLQGILTCPICGSADAERVPSSVAVRTRDGRRSAPESDDAGPTALSPRKALQLLHAYLDRHCDDVGSRFAEVALRMHHGEEEQRNIKGVTTATEEQTLREEGVSFFKVPIPKFDS